MIPFPLGLPFYTYLTPGARLVIWDRIAFALHLGVFGAGLHPGGPGCPEKPWNGHHYHPEQPLLMQFF